MTGAPYEAWDDSGMGVRLFLRVTPGARSDEIIDVWRGANGEQRFSVKVSAPPDKGKANAAVIKLLARRLGLPKSAFSIMAGETSRLKTIAVSGETTVIVAAIKNLSGDAS